MAQIRIVDVWLRSPASPPSYYRSVMVIAEKPKIMPRAAEIRNAVSNALSIEPGRVSIKATTNEGLGSLGRGEGIAAYATATLRLPWSAQ